MASSRGDQLETSGQATFSKGWIRGFARDGDGVAVTWEVRREAHRLKGPAGNLEKTRSRLLADLIE